MFSLFKLTSEIKPRDDILYWGSFTLPTACREHLPGASSSLFILSREGQLGNLTQAFFMIQKIEKRFFLKVYDPLHAYVRGH